MANECVYFSWCKELLIFRFNVRTGARRRKFGWSATHGQPWDLSPVDRGAMLPSQTMVGSHRSTLKKNEGWPWQKLASSWAGLARKEMSYGAPCTNVKVDREYRVPSGPCACPSKPEAPVDREISQSQPCHAQELPSVAEACAEYADGVCWEEATGRPWVQTKVDRSVKQ